MGIVSLYCHQKQMYPLMFMQMFYQCTTVAIVSEYLNKTSSTNEILNRFSSLTTQLSRAIFTFVAYFYVFILE